MADADYEGQNGGRYDDELRYERRDRSASPRDAKREDNYRERRRSASPGRAPAPRNGVDNDEAPNPGSNLFVTGIHPRLTEADVTTMFEKHGVVESCSIMKDPHTQESRGFGFVKMATTADADAAKEALQGENIEGRTMNIEKARRARPRTPTPGRYFGPPKRDDIRRGGRDGGRYGGRDDGYRGGGRYDDRRGFGGRRDDYGRGGDRYAGGRDDRYESRRYDDRRGGDYERSAPRDGGYGGPREQREPRENREPREQREFRGGEDRYAHSSM